MQVALIVSPPHAAKKVKVETFICVMVYARKQEVDVDAQVAELRSKLEIACRQVQSLRENDTWLSGLLVN